MRADLSSVSMGQAASTLTLRARITGKRQFAARIWIAGRICALMAFVIGTRFHLAIELDGSDAS